MGIEKRKQERIDKVLVVRYRHHDETHEFFTNDLSATGMYIMTSATYEPGTVLDIEVLDGDRRVPIRGVVRWSKKASATASKAIEGGMGIEVVEGKTPDYLSLLAPEP